eukprot:GILK01012453.1.p1 GENE.GILK01012453.1~~GILK01012453.1.p1  ORF type:complete len:506 (+),score=83.12 GILK01012453.1:34-1551(+)
MSALAASASHVLSDLRAKVSVAMSHDISPSYVYIILTIVAIFLLWILKRLIFRSPDVKVNCWFCNKDSKVVRHAYNSWICPHCDQYNGFTKDGNYNQDISSLTAHHSYTTNTYSTDSAGLSRSSPRPSSSTHASPLCASCAHNTLQYVQSIAQFEPSNEARFQQEAEEYRENMERLYRLCNRCSETVQTSLTTLDDKLRKERFNQSLERSRKMLTSIAPIPTSRETSWLSPLLPLWFLFLLSKPFERFSLALLPTNDSDSVVLNQVIEVIQRYISATAVLTVSLIAGSIFVIRQIGLRMGSTRLNLALVVLLFSVWQQQHFYFVLFISCLIWIQYIIDRSQNDTFASTPSPIKSPLRERNDPVSQVGSAVNRFAKCDALLPTVNLASFSSTNSVRSRKAAANTKHSDAMLDDLISRFNFDDLVSDSREDISNTSTDSLPESSRLSPFISYFPSLSKRRVALCVSVLLCVVVFGLPLLSSAIARLKAPNQWIVHNPPQTVINDSQR